MLTPQITWQGRCLIQHTPRLPFKLLPSIIDPSRRWDKLSIRTKLRSTYGDASVWRHREWLPAPFTLKMHRACFSCEAILFVDVIIAEEVVDRLLRLNNHVGLVSCIVKPFLWYATYWNTRRDERSLGIWSGIVSRLVCSGAINASWGQEEVRIR